MSDINLKNQIAPSNPISGRNKLYIDSNGYLSKINNAGDITLYKPLDKVIVVTQASDLAGTLLSDVLYVIDGSVDMGATQITVPPTGLAISGHGFGVSKLTTSAIATNLFTYSGTAGNLFASKLELTANGPASKVFNLDNNGAGGTVELETVNFNNCTAIGELTEYRQFLAVNLGIFGCINGFTFTGIRTGGARIDTAIVRSFTGTLFRAGAGLLFNNRFVTNINADIPSGSTFADFSDVNFANDADFELLGVRLSGGASYLPNIDGTNIKSRFRDCKGIRNTYVGAQWVVSTPVTTIITTVSTPVKVAGITTYTDEQWFSNTLSNAFTYISDEDLEFEIKGVIALAGSNNREVNMIIRKWDDSFGAYSDISESGTITLNGSGRAENTAILGYTSLSKNDRIELWIENNSDTTDITALIGGLVSIEERSS